MAQVAFEEPLTSAQIALGEHLILAQVAFEEHLISEYPESIALKTLPDEHYDPQTRLSSVSNIQLKTECKYIFETIAKLKVLITFLNC